MQAAYSFPPSDVLFNVDHCANDAELVTHKPNSSRSNHPTISRMVKNRLTCGQATEVPHVLDTLLNFPRRIVLGLSRGPCIELAGMV